MENPKLARVQNEGAVGIYAWGKGRYRLFRNLIIGPHRMGINVSSDNNLIANNTILSTSEAAVYLHEKRVGNSLFNNIVGGTGQLVALNTASNTLDYTYYVGVCRWSWQGKAIKELAAW